MAVRLLALVLGLSLPATAAADEPVAWRGDYQSARAEALAKQRPILLVVGTATCRDCERQDRETHQNLLVRLACRDRVVPLKIDGNREAALTKALAIKTFPTTILASAGGDILDYHSGPTSPELLLATLDRHAPGPDPVAPAEVAASEAISQAIKRTEELAELYAAAGRKAEAEDARRWVARLRPEPRDPHAPGQTVAAPAGGRK